MFRKFKTQLWSALKRPFHIFGNVDEEEINMKLAVLKTKLASDRDMSLSPHTRRVIFSNSAFNFHEDQVLHEVSGTRNIILISWMFRRSYTRNRVARRMAYDLDDSDCRVNHCIFR